MTFTISTAEDGTARLAIEGELDAVSVSELRPELEKLLARQPSRIDVDVSRLRMVDSSGVGALVSLYKRARAQGGSVVVQGLRDQPLAIFRLLRLDRVMVGAELSPSPAGTTSSSKR
jgi:anti-sigma B factor antagonist